MASVKIYVRVQNIFASFKIVACLVVILGGLYELGIGKEKRYNLEMKFTSVICLRKDGKSVEGLGRYVVFTQRSSVGFLQWAMGL